MRFFVTHLRLFMGPVYTLAVNKSFSTLEYSVCTYEAMSMRTATTDRNACEPHASDRLAEVLAAGMKHVKVSPRHFQIGISVARPPVTPDQRNTRDLRDRTMLPTRTGTTRSKTVRLNYLARLDAAVATGPLGELSHDELGVVFDGLADPLQPVVAVALSSTCHGMRMPLRAALEMLKKNHRDVLSLCSTLSMYIDRRRDKVRLVDLRVATVLNWSMHDLQSWDGKTIGMLLPKWRSLTNIYLNFNQLGDSGVKALADGVAAGGWLKRLELKGNRITDKGAKALATCVAVSGSLISLELCKNRIGYEGAKALAHGVAISSSLQILRLGGNEFGDQGLHALATCVAASRSLRVLELSSCHIGDEVTKALAAASGSLESLVLNNNQIGDVGAKALAKLLATSVSLGRLGLASNSIGDEGALAFIEGMKLSRCSFFCLALYDNKISQIALQALIEVASSTTPRCTVRI